MPCFLHAADLHVDSPLNNLDVLDPAVGERLRGASRTALRNLTRLALERRVAFVVLSGDLFDETHQSVEASFAISDELRELSQAGIRTYLVRGNHDYLGPHSVRYWPEGVYELDARQPETHHLEDLRVAIHGQSFPERHVTRDLTLEYPPAVPGWLNIGLLHTALSGLSGQHGHYAETSLARLGTLQYQYWALGHVHAFAEHPLPGGRAVYPGNLQGRHIREQGPKGVAIVTWEGSQIQTVEHVPCDVVRWHEVICPLSPLPLQDQILQAVSQTESATAPDRRDGRDVAVRVRLQGLCVEGQALPISELRQQLREALRARLGGSVLLEELRVEATESPALPEALESELAAARDRLKKQPELEDLARDSGQLWNRLGELGTETRNRLGIGSAEELRLRMLELGARRVAAVIARGQSDR